MAVAEVKLVCEKCGESFRYRRKVMNRSAADNLEEWTRENMTVCPDCYRKMEIEAERQRINEIIENMDKPALPELKGTEKQVKWATDIRNKALSLVAKKKPNQAFWDCFCSKTEATWWIDHRNEADSLYSFASLLQNEKG